MATILQNIAHNVADMRAVDERIIQEVRGQLEAIHNPGGKLQWNKCVETATALIAQFGISMGNCELTSYQDYALILTAFLGATTLHSKPLPPLTPENLQSFGPDQKGYKN